MDNFFVAWSRKKKPNSFSYATHQPFWLALIYAGAHAYGLKQEGNIHVEMGKRMFPNDYIGTAAYDAWLAERAQTRFHK